MTALFYSGPSKCALPLDLGECYPINTELLLEKREGPRNFSSRPPPGRVARRVGTNICADLEMP